MSDFEIMREHVLEALAPQPEPVSINKAVEAVRTKVQTLGISARFSDGDIKSAILKAINSGHLQLDQDLHISVTKEFKI